MAMRAGIALDVSRRRARLLPWTRIAVVVAIVALAVPTSAVIGSAAPASPFTLSPTSLPNAGGLVLVRLDPAYTGPCPLTTTNPGVALTNCVPSKGAFDLWIPPSAQPRPLVTTFTFMGTVDGMPPTTATSTVTQAAAPTSPTFVALGDSYTSGEGNRDPANGGWVDLNGRPDRTPTADDGCDRSWLSYPRRAATWTATQPSLPRMRFVFLSCSGVTTSDIWSGSPAAADGLRGQTLRHLEGVQLADTADLSHARIVTLTAGANDVGYGPVSSACTMPGVVNTQAVSVAPIAAGGRLLASRVATRGSRGTRAARPRKRPCTARLRGSPLGPLPPTELHLEQALVGTYLQIEAEAPDAALYVVGYPYLVPASLSPSNIRNGCSSLPGTEIRDLARVEVTLDTAIQQAARAVGAHYVDPNRGASADFPDHTLCSSRGVWFYGLSRVPAYSYHPNVLGQIALFDDLRSSIKRSGVATPTLCQRLQLVHHRFDVLHAVVPWTWGSLAAPGCARSGGE
jgi:lysophospholipase L1-like esterase